jgi:hypothetical protein
MRVSSVGAVTRAANEARSPSRDWTGYCLMWVRTMLGIPVKYPSAIKAWEGAADKHTSGNPPEGVPVFWRGGNFGHVALSAGGGKVYSTDIRRRGKVDLVPITEIRDRWGYTYLGWATDLNGVDITLPAPPAPPTVAVSLKALQHSARNPGEYVSGGTDDVVNVKGYLVRHRYAEASDSFRTAYAKFQRHLGYTGDDADGVPGMTTLRILARSANWRVIA